MEWQPIETAPKDGSWLLVSNAEKDGAWIARYYEFYPSGYKPDNPWFSLMLNHDGLPNPRGSSFPTHWMPLPEPPK